ncbi:hypothetical protein A3B39_05430 [Candidatus Daviesbacteria bacterium RIFCSPLOWO2_01_FULL_37_10]|nr:MAG: hypothetical protein A3B39_05430 [Candidatus Daviesbacteria bacterium RIFCSPLOWO2_01_FULL_37_10]
MSNPELKISESIGEWRPFLQERLDMGSSQIIDKEELIPGKIVISRGLFYGSKQTTAYSEELKVLKLPQKNSKGKWVVSVESVHSGHQTIEHLSDLGVVAYESGLWNPSNWLEDPIKTVPPQKA